MNYYKKVDSNNNVIGIRKVSCKQSNPSLIPITKTEFEQLSTILDSQHKELHNAVKSTKKSALKTDIQNIITLEDVKKVLLKLI